MSKPEEKSLRQNEEETRFKRKSILIWVTPESANIKSFPLYTVTMYYMVKMCHYISRKCILKFF